MAYYNYKRVRDLIPQFIIDQQGEDYEGLADYDGDLWCAASDYIKLLVSLLDRCRDVIPEGETVLKDDIKDALRLK